MKILLRRAGLVNKGAEAMLRVTRAQLQRLLPDARFAVLPESFPPQHRSRVNELGFELVVPREQRNSLSLLRRLGPRAVVAKMATAAGDRTLCKSLASFDAILDLSGYAYGDVWGPSRAEATTRFVRGAKSIGIPYIFLPQTWGPFERVEDRPVYRTMLENCGGYFARDSISRANLSKLLDIGIESVPLQTDIAFAFEPAEPDEAKRHLSEAGVDATRPLAVVGPSRKVFTDSEGNSRGEYCRVLVEVVDALVEKGYSIALVPHELNVEATEIDDGSLCDLLAGCANARHEKGRVVSLSHIGDAGVLKAVVSLAKLVVSSRFHCLVAALSSGVPVLALGWSYKYRELLAPFGFDGSCVDLRQGGSITSDSVHSLLDALHKNREHQRSQILVEAAVHREAAIRFFERIAAAVNGGKSIAIENSRENTSQAVPVHSQANL